MNHTRIRHWQAFQPYCFYAWYAAMAASMHDKHICVLHPWKHLYGLIWMLVYMNQNSFPAYFAWLVPLHQRLQSHSYTQCQRTHISLFCSTLRYQRCSSFLHSRFWGWKMAIMSGKKPEMSLEREKSTPLSMHFDTYHEWIKEDCISCQWHTPITFQWVDEKQASPSLCFSKQTCDDTASFYLVSTNNEFLRILINPYTFKIQD